MKRKLLLSSVTGTLRSSKFTVYFQLSVHNPLQPIVRSNAYETAVDVSLEI